MTQLLFIFLDGVGIGTQDSGTNPFFQANLPMLKTLLGGTLPHLDAPEVKGAGSIAFPLDPLLGVEGLPQSGTGQAALLTGENAPALYGRHFGPWVPVLLRPLVEEKNILSRAQAMGASCAFPNAYPKEFKDSKWAQRPAGPPIAATAAGLMTRQAEALVRGEALSSEIVNTVWRSRLGYAEIPDITPQEAGRNLARLSNQAELTFFAHYTTDYAGHRGKMEGAVETLERVDAFLGGLLERLSQDALLVVASDHGNVEDVTQGHTLNPVLAILAGPGAADHRRGLRKITDIPSLILKVLSER